MNYEFLFFRHGETDWNQKQIFQGHTDIPLNEKGLAQAQDLGERIQDWHPDVVLSSDLIRARVTAEDSLKYWKSPVVVSDQLREMNLGKAEGLHRNDVMKLVGEDWVKWISPGEGDENFGFPGGETKAETRLRIFRFLEDYVKKNPQHKRIAVSTHGGVIRRVTDGLPGTPASGVPIPNCVTYRLNYESGVWKFIQDRKRTSTVVIHDNKILAFKAKDPTNHKHYHFLPGGKLEEGEEPYACAVRETLEETGYQIRANAEKKLTREYDFEWDGQLYWSRTDFFKSHLSGEYFDPRPVKDASYHLGVEWVSVSDLEKYFSYTLSVKNGILQIIS